MYAGNATIATFSTRSVTGAGRVSMGGGVELSYLDRGKGQAIVFIPGWTFTKEIFAQQLDYFETHYRVITYDPRSQGTSTFTLEGNDYMTHAEDLAALLRALDVKNPILVGWGSGALTAWNFVKLHGPGAIAANIIIDQSPKCISNNDMDWTQGKVEDLGAAHTLFLRNKQGLAQYIKRCLETKLTQRPLTFSEMSMLTTQCMSTNPLVAAQLYACGMFTDVSAAAMAACRLKPTLFYIAEQWSGRATSFVRRIMPEARIDVFGAHMMFWEYPDRFNHSLHRFLNLYLAKA